MLNVFFQILSFRLDLLIEENTEVFEHDKQKNPVASEFLFVSMCDYLL